MKTFAHPDQAGHHPAFFLQRGRVRANFEVPARAAALEAALHRIGLAPSTPEAAPLAALQSVHSADYLAFLAEAALDWSQLADPGPEVVANMHPSPEMLAQGAACGDGIIARAGWYMADTPARLVPAPGKRFKVPLPAPWPPRAKRLRGGVPMRCVARPAITPMPRALGGIAM